MAASLDLPDDIAALAEKVAPQASEKTADAAFTLHQQEQWVKKLDCKFMKRLDAMDQELVPLRMNIQFYCNKVTLWLEKPV